MADCGSQHILSGRKLVPSYLEVMRNDSIAEQDPTSPTASSTSESLRNFFWETCVCCTMPFSINDRELCSTTRCRKLPDPEAKQVDDEKYITL